MKPIFFSSEPEFRKWLEKNHNTAQELWVGYYKRNSGIPSITWPESVDEALCYGWIDGIRKSVDEKSYMIRFTPRRPKSNWSAVNIKRVAELTKLGLMKPAGIAAFDRRNEKNSEVYSFERKAVKLNKKYEALFRKYTKAWKYFSAQPPSYKKTAMWWVMSAKQEATQMKRLLQLIADSAAGLRIKQLRRTSGNKM
ncbi:YdeI/OmpD-associated family protein [bacterium]|nr:YdeI/OmpD-associated family protein [bacterium]